LIARFCVRRLSVSLKLAPDQAVNVAMQARLRFSHIAKENAALSAVFGISTTQKLLLEIGATNARRRGACFIGS